jgi:hypothetical protein
MESRCVCSCSGECPEERHWHGAKRVPPCDNPLQLQYDEPWGWRNGIETQWAREALSSSTAKSADEIRSELLGGASWLAGRVQRLARLRGAAWWGFSVLLPMLALIALDIILRREELGLRWLSLALWVGAVSWGTWKFLQPVWKLVPTPHQMARWVERTRPDLGDRLSTAVQLAEAPVDDERFGSRAFREAVLRSWHAETHKPEWSAYLDSRQAWRAVMLLAALLIGSFAVMAARPFESRLALQRFFVPWGAPAWPRRDQLEFVNLPAVAAIGSELQLEIIDRNEPLPDNVVVRFRNVGGSAVRESEIPAKVIDQLAIANLPPLESAIEVRALGGDDLNMPWRRIDVVSPPMLEQYQFSIEPPSYSGRPPVELIGTRIQVLSGSKLSFTGQLDQPVRSAAVRRLDEGTDEEALSLMVSGNPATRIAIGFGNGQSGVLTSSVAWRLLVETVDGLQIELPQRWAIDVVADAPPTAVLAPPSLNLLTSSGQIDIAGSANDDLGLERLAVVASIDGAATEAVSRELWSGSDEKLQNVVVSAVWDVTATLEQAGQPIMPGQILTVWLEARDQLGQIGRSQVERIEIQSEEKVVAALVDRQEKLLSQLREMITVQRRNQGMTEQTERQVRLSTAATQADVDALNGVAQSQSSLANQLAGQQGSLLEQIDELQRLLKLNRLSPGSLAGQLDSLRSQLEGVAEEDMPQAVAASAAAHHEAAELLQGTSTSVEPALQKLTQSSQAQLNVLEKIQGLADRLNRSGGIQQLQQELSALVRKQELLQSETEGLQLEQLRGARRESVENARRALMAEQESVAQQLDALVDRARELISQQDGEIDSAGESLRQAVDSIGDGQASQFMHRAAEQIAGRELTSAIESQRTAVESLARAMQQLEPTAGRSRGNDLSQQAQQLLDRRAAVSELAGAQQSLANELRKAAADPDNQLAERQNGLAEATDRQAQLARQQGDGASGEQLETIAESQAAAGQAAAESKMQAAATEAERAANDLERLAEQLQQRADELSRQSQRQQMYQLQDSLQNLVNQQRPLVDNIDQLAMQFSEDIPRDDSLQQQSRHFAAEQEAVRQQLEELRLRVGDLAAFGWVLEQTDEDMAKAVAAAERFRVAPDAQVSASDALRKLQLTLEAAQSAANSQLNASGQQSTTQDAGDQQAGDDQSQQSIFPPLASLKLLRGLQRELNAQTQQLEAEQDLSRRNRRLRWLADQQQAIGTQLEALLREMGRDR